MPRLQQLPKGRLDLGLIDGVADDEVPAGAFISSRGFHYRRGYPYTEDGRSKLTSSEIQSSARVFDIIRWERASGTVRYYALVNGGLFEGTTPTAFATLRSTLDVGASTATRAGTAVTIAAGGKCLLTVQAGDYFYYNADGISSGGVVASVDSDTALTLTSYAGSGTSGAFTLWRKLSATQGKLVIAGDRVWVFDGTNRPHWFGDDGSGSNDIFRVAGMAAPASRPTIALGAGGQLSDGDYWWEVAYEDAAGRISNTIRTMTVTATASQESILSAFENGPEWAIKIRIYRTKKDGAIAYNVCPDVTTQLASSVKDNGTSTLTLHTSAAALIQGMHVDRYVKFLASGNTYLITANAATTITVSGDASSATGGETGTDYISITGGFDIDQLVAGSFNDIIPDANLDTDHEAPDENDQPPTKLLYGHLFEGGGRLVAYEDDTQSQVWFSGRTIYAAVPTGEAASGLGEFDYWPVSHYVGRQDGDEVQGFFNLGLFSFCVKKRSTWQLYKEPDSVGDWSWYPVSEVGCLAVNSIVVKEGTAYWLGHDGEELDLIRFDGNVGFGYLRQQDYRIGGPKLRATLETMTSISESTATIFQGKLYLSYPYTQDPAVTTNDRTLRYDFKRNTLDIQPWGCGVFAAPYQDTDVTFKLLCGDPTNLGNVYQVLGSAQDASSNIARELITRAIKFPEIAAKGKWVHLLVEAIHDEALTTAPVISYSIDGLRFDDSNKVWKTTVSGDTWPTTAGEYPLRFNFEIGERSRGLMLKITSTDAKNWGIKQLEIWGAPFGQLQPLDS